MNRQTNGHWYVCVTGSMHKTKVTFLFKKEKYFIWANNSAWLAGDRLLSSFLIKTGTLPGSTQQWKNQQIQSTSHIMWWVYHHSMTQTSRWPR